MNTRASTGERIWQAALTLFARQGFAGTSTRDIADASGLTQGSLYHYMGSKDDLLEQVMFGAMTGLVNSSRELAASTTGDPVSTLAGLVQLHVAVHARHRMEAMVVDREVAQLGPANQKRITAMRDEYENLWRTTILSGVEAGRFVVPDARLATLALLGMCTEVATWYRPRGRMSVDLIGLRFVEMGLGMLHASDPSGRPAQAADVSLTDIERFLAIYEERGGHGMLGAKSTARAGS